MVGTVGVAAVALEVNTIGKVPPVDCEQEHETWQHGQLVQQHSRCMPGWLHRLPGRQAEAQTPLSTHCSPVTQVSMAAWASRPTADSTAAVVSALLPGACSSPQQGWGWEQQRTAWQQMAAAAQRADTAPAARMTVSTQGGRERVRAVLSSSDTPIAVPAAANCMGWGAAGLVRCKGAQGRRGTAAPVHIPCAAGQASGCAVSPLRRSRVLPRRQVPGPSWLLGSRGTADWLVVPPEEPAVTEKGAARRAPACRPQRGVKGVL